VGDYGVVSYLPRPEGARLWRLARGAFIVPPVTRTPDPPAPPGHLTPAARFQAGMERLNAGDHKMARAHFALVRDTDAPEADDAAFFYAVTRFRDSDWLRAAHEFKRLLHRHPAGRWTPPIPWHLAICDLRRGRLQRAREHFRWIVRSYPEDPATVEGARGELRRMSPNRGGLVGALWSRLTAAAP
jgi:TolA-binding protein